MEETRDDRVKSDDGLANERTLRGTFGWNKEGAFILCSS